MSMTPGTYTRTSPQGDITTVIVDNKTLSYHTDLQHKGFLYKDDDDWLNAAVPQTVRVHHGSPDSACISCEG